MNERARMVNLAELDPATGQFAEGFGPRELGPGGPGGFQGGPGGPGGFRGRGAGRAFLLGGRGARGQRAYQGSATYTFGGSVLDSPPYQLNPAVPSTQPVFAQNTVGATFGGPLKIPGVYADANRRTTFQVNYTGNRSNNVFDEYATVPTDAERNGDFSASPGQLVDPATGQPFAGNQIPAGRISSGAATLLQFIPAANLPGTTRNYHVSTTAYSSSEGVSLRLIQNLSKNAPQARNGRGGRAVRAAASAADAAGRSALFAAGGTQRRPQRTAAVSAQRPRAAERLPRSRQQHDEHEPDGADQPHRAPRPLDPEHQRQRRAQLDRDRQSRSRTWRTSARWPAFSTRRAPPAIPSTGACRT